MPLTNLQLRTSSSEKRRPKRKRDHFENGAFNVESASSLEHLLAASPDSRHGFKRLALSEALTASTRQKTDVMSTASNNQIEFHLVCLDRTNLMLKCPFISYADEFIWRRNADLPENQLGSKRRAGRSRSLKQKRSPKESRLFSTTQWETNCFQNSTPMTKQSNEGVHSAPSKPSLPDSIKPFMLGNARMN